MQRQQSELLESVGPGSPCGDLLRRYWWPVGLSRDLEDRPTLVRVLGEDLVLFRDGQGRVGLLDAACSHRCSNLCLGTVESDGLRCRYHGWKYGHDGSILEMPGQPHFEKVAALIHHRAYRIVERIGIIFAYLGPEPAPLLPQYDFLVGDGDREVDLLGVSEGAWFRWVDNNLDPNHVSFAHGDVGALADLVSVPDRIGFVNTSYGIYHQAWRRLAKENHHSYREHHFVFPTIGVTGAGQRRIEGGSGPPAVGVQWTTPIEDHAVLVMYFLYKPAANTGRIGSPLKMGHGRVLEPIKFRPYDEYRGGEVRPLGYGWPKGVVGQDAAITEAMGRIKEREREFLVVGDEGIARGRNLYLAAIKDVKDGKDPMGVFRKPDLVRVTAHERVLAEHEEPAGVA